jgi:hypothetical protein
MESALSCSRLTEKISPTIDGAPASSLPLRLPGRKSNIIKGFAAVTAD